MASFVAVLVLALQPVQAQSQLRTVIGHVLNAQNQPLQKAVVHLKNTRTLAVRSYISKEDGNYQFSGLSQNVDYEVYAELDGQKSDTKTLSGFDTRPRSVINLKVPVKK